MKTYLQQMMCGLEDEKSREAMKDYLIWKEDLQMSQSLTIRDLFKYLKLFIGDLPFDYEVKYYTTGGYQLFDSSFISFRDINTYYAIIKPKQASLKDIVILEVSYDMLNLCGTTSRNKMIAEFIELYQENYLRKPNFIGGARVIDMASR